MAKLPKQDRNRLEHARKKLVACGRALRARMAKDQADAWRKAEAVAWIHKDIKRT